LDAAEPAEIQTAALRAMIETARDAQPIFQRWKGFSPRVREAALDAMLAQRDSTRQLIAAIQSQQVAVADIGTLHRQQLIKASSTLAELFQSSQAPERAKVLAGYQDSLKLSGDAKRGAELFTKHCASCHKIGETGHEIGPNLAAMKTRGAEAILTNVLDPNREVNPQYVTYVVVTKEGRTISGMIAAETATSLTLRRAENAQDTVLRLDIDELQSTGLSLMPEGLEKQLDQQQLADVMAFILK
jgi:putative heme-binding domain-containing protein